MFVAGFIGSPAMNVMSAQVTEGGARFGTAVLPVDRATLADAGAEVSIGLRPEDLEIRRAGGSGLQVSVHLVEELGADGYVYAHVEQAGGADRRRRPCQ